MIRIENDDYKTIKKELGLSPEQWIRIQKEAERREKDKLRNDFQVQIFSCKCGSVWCPQCAKSSSTNERINERLRSLDFRKVRHIMLSVSRIVAPEFIYAAIREKKAVYNTVKRLGMSNEKYLWVLEFHKGGYPHWHLLIESETGMIGKKKIERAWQWGLVWESYIKNKDHWNAICGYHKNKGYLAGENKAHQLELPDYLLEKNRIRKFGSNFNVLRGTIPEENVLRGTIPEENVLRGTIPEENVPHGTLRNREQKTYKDRKTTCNKECIICINEIRYETVKVPGYVARTIAAEILDEITVTTFRGQKEQGMRFLDKLRELEKQAQEE